MKNGEEIHIGYLVKQIVDKIAAKGNHDLKRYGLTFSQSRVLQYLHVHGDQATQKEIEMHLGVTHPTVVGIINRLERDGFVCCWQDEKDRRIKNIRLTTRAEQVTDALDQSIRRSEENLISCFTKEEAAQLASLLGRLNECLSQRDGGSFEESDRKDGSRKK